MRGRGRPSENSRIIAFFQRTQRKRDEDGGEKMEAYETNAGTQATCRWLASHCHGPHRETLNLITCQNVVLCPSKMSEENIGVGEIRAFSTFFFFFLNRVLK